MMTMMTMLMMTMTMRMTFEFRGFEALRAFTRHPYIRRADPDDEKEYHCGDEEDSICSDDDPND